MSIVSIFLLAVALSMDACAVALSTGVVVCTLRMRYAVRMAALFGLFQAIMPLAGWSVGRFASGYVKAFDHWIAFVLLSAIGGKMLFEALHTGKEANAEKKDPHNIFLVITLAFATSIDAAAVGISLSFLNVAVVLPSIIIGITTAVLSFIAYYLGCRFGDLWGKKIEIIGGVILVGLGVKILIEHLFFQ
jgi:manganese efflux pump family protein